MQKCVSGRLKPTLRIVQLKLNQPVILTIVQRPHIDITKKLAMFSNGQSHHFNRLLIAMGSDPIIPSILGSWKQRLIDQPLQFMDAYVAVAGRHA